MGQLRPPAPGQEPEQRSSVRIELERDSADSVRGEHHLLILEKDGEEMARAQAYNIVSGPSPSEQRWWNTAVLYLPGALSPPFVVHADDHVLGLRCSWSVDALGKIKRLPSSEAEPLAPTPPQPPPPVEEVPRPADSDAEEPPSGAS